jgi:hypothetical protein
MKLDVSMPLEMALDAYLELLSECFEKYEVIIK